MSMENKAYEPAPNAGPFGPRYLSPDKERREYDHHGTRPSKDEIEEKREAYEKWQRDSAAQVSTANDPWANRSSGMKCRTCMWFVIKTGFVPATLGRCRRHAPTMSGYPAVYESDWCGDHKVDEGKI